MTVVVILILWVYKPRRLSKLKMTENINFFYAFAANLGFIEIPSNIYGMEMSMEKSKVS